MNEIEEEKAIQTAISNLDGRYTDFDGNNCDEDRNCLGWDGMSHRCDCGNRRVSWEISFNEPSTYRVYAAAY